MLFLVLQLGNDRYAVEAAQVVEVLPVVKVRHLPRAPTGLVGVFDYHGQPVPLVDLTELALGTPSRQWMSTRIIVVNYSPHPGATKTLGLLAEQATETMRRSEADFIDAGVSVAAASYLGSVTTHAGDIIQRIEIQNLLSGSVRNLLFGERIGLP
jgi:chemotaxis-related protein WspB